MCGIKSTTDSCVLVRAEGNGVRLSSLAFMAAESVRAQQLPETSRQLVRDFFSASLSYNHATLIDNTNSFSYHKIILTHSRQMTASFED